MSQSKILNINPNTLSKREKIGQFFFPAAFINDSDSEIKQLEKLIKNHTIGGLTFFHSRASAATNYESKKKVIRNENSQQRLKELIDHYQSIASTPLLMSIDAEWGLAMRVENTPQYPYAITLGALPDEQAALIFDVGKHIGEDLKSMGIHLNLAPVADINMNPNNPVIGYRSFGEDKLQITQRAISFYKGLTTTGVLGCFKHFPGHGDTEVDSHLGLPIIHKSKMELYDQELYPFIKAIQQGIGNIMIGHLAVPALSNGKSISATLSKDMIKGILRKEFGFEGVVISDALNMHSVSKLYPEKGVLEWKAFDAGNDILCFAEHVKEGILAIEKNASDQQIEESFERVWKMKQKAFSTQNLSTSKGASLHPSVLNQQLAEQSITTFKGAIKTLETFKKEGFEAISIGRPACVFLDEISNEIDFRKHTYSEEMAHKFDVDNILVALFPPSVKPANNFGIPQKTIQFLSVLSTTKKVVIYLFGNPYALRVLNTDAIRDIVIAYQDFESFQQTAAKHFLGKLKALGKIPVQL